MASLGVELSQESVKRALEVWEAAKLAGIAEPIVGAIYRSIHTTPEDPFKGGFCLWKFLGDRWSSKSDSFGAWIDCQPDCPSCQRMFSEDKFVLWKESEDAGI